MVNKLLLVLSRFVCATVIQVNNRSRYTAAVFTSLYVIVSTTSQFVNDELIIKMWMANMSTSYYLISDRLRLHTEWVSLSLGLQRWGKIFSELLLLFTWFFAAITFRVESVKEWVVINPKKLLDFADLSHWSCRYFAKRWGCYKVHIFWEGHKNLQNLHSRFDRYYKGQI